MSFLLRGVDGKRLDSEVQSDIGVPDSIHTGDREPSTGEISIKKSIDSCLVHTLNWRVVDISAVCICLQSRKFAPQHDALQSNRKYLSAHAHVM